MNRSEGLGKHRIGQRVCLCTAMSSFVKCWCRTLKRDDNGLCNMRRQFPKGWGVMPISRIEVRKRWNAEDKRRLMETLHNALMATFKIPAGDKLIRFVEHAPEDFIVPPGCTENYVLVELSIFPGRSLDAKRQLYRAIVDGLGELKIAPTDVRIVLHEIPMENWGIRGGIPASEVDLGFSVTV